jgi:hypothetical protein
MANSWDGTANFGNVMRKTGWQAAGFDPTTSRILSYEPETISPAAGIEADTYPMPSQPPRR